MKQELMKVINNTGLALKKHSPEILAGVGIVGSIAAIVMACKATTKAPQVIEDTKKELDYIHRQELGETEGYTEKDRGKAVAKVYFKTGMAFAKLYGPAITLEILSLGCILGSTDIYRKRNAELASTLIAANEGFKRYRNNVVERFGEEVDYELEHGIKHQEIQTEEVDPETGKTKKVKKTIEVADPNRTGGYTKYFTRTNPYWDEISDNGKANDDYLEMFFGMRESELSTRVSAKRHSVKDPYVTLNDAFEAYGFEREQYGYVPCWKYDKEKGNLCCDISWHKVNIKNEENKFEEVYAIDFRPKYSSQTGELL